MMTYLRVAYLWLVLVTVSVGAGYALLSREAIALLASRALGDEALPMARTEGAFALYLFTIARGLYDDVPTILEGMALGLLCRVAGAIRGYRRQRAKARIHTLTDRFGGKLVMHHAPLEHDPDVRDLHVADIDATRLPPGATPIERDALGLLAAYPDVPADLDGHHGTTLAEHSWKAWKLACDKHGAGSLEAQIALCHDLGKIRAYHRDDSGQWVLHGLHPQLGLQVVRDLDGYLEMPAGARREFMDLLTALQTGCIPVELTARQRSILRAVQHVDFKTTGEEKAQGDEPSMTPQDLADLLRGSVPQLLDTLNINRRLDANAAPDGFFLPESHALLVAEQALRLRIAGLLPGELAASLKLLDKGPKGTHPARDLIVQTAQLLFETFEVYDDKPARHGTFRIRSGVRTYDNVIAIKAGSIPETLIRTWGKWKYEVDTL